LHLQRAIFQTARCDVVAGNIFVSYRRNDDPGFPQAIYLQLEREFPQARLVVDVEGRSRRAITMSPC
jgi:hypothetical protein